MAGTGSFVKTGGGIDSLAFALDFGGAGEVDEPALWGC